MSLKERLALIESLNRYTLEIGVQGRDPKKVRAQGGEKDSPELTLIEVAAQNEFGTKEIPARPWLRTSVDLYKAEWLKSMRKISSLAVLGKANLIEQGWRIFGVEAVSNVQNTLLHYPWKPNAPGTIESKKSSKPLVDTGQLLQSQRAVLVDGDKRELIG